MEFEELEDIAREAMSNHTVDRCVERSDGDMFYFISELTHEFMNSGPCYRLRNTETGDCLDCCHRNGCGRLALELALDEAERDERRKEAGA